MGDQGSSRELSPSITAVTSAQSLTIEALIASAPDDVFERAGYWRANACVAVVQREALMQQVSELRAALRLAGDFIEEEADNRGTAGSVMSDYEREPRELLERIDAVLSSASPAAGESSRDESQ